MKKLVHLAALVAAFCFLGSTAWGTTVTGHVFLPSGAAPSSNAVTVRFVLKNYGQVTPRVTSTATFATPTYDFIPNGAGLFTGTIYGNDVITPSGTYYQVVVLYRGQALVPPQTYNVTGSTWDLDTATPMVAAPTPVGQILTAKSFEFTQSTPATTWTINHNFGDRNVVFSCYGTSPTAGTGTQYLVPDTATETNINTLTITFVTAQAGSCNVMNAGNTTLSMAPGNAFLLNPNATQTVNTKPSVFTGTVYLNGGTPSINSILYLDGTVWNGATDLGATLNAMIASFPAVGGYKSGKIIIPCGTYPLTSSATVTSPYVSIEGSGSACTIINSSLNGDAFRVNTNPFVVTQAGKLSGFTLNGNSGANAVGIHMGDIIGLGLDDLVIQNFTGANSSGLWMDNVTEFTERTVTTRVHLNFNTKDLRLTVSGSPESSFGYNKFLDLKLNVGAAQTGISVENNAFLYNGILFANANGTGAGKTIVSIVNTAALDNELYDIVSEDTDSSGGTFLNVASMASVNGTGVISDVSPTMSNTISGPFEMFPSLFGTSAQSYIPFDVNGILSARISAGTMGTSLMPITGSTGNFELGVGSNFYWGGTQWLLNGDGTGNGGSAILTNPRSPEMDFVVVPSIAGTSQAVSPGSLGTYTLGTLTQQGGLSIYGLNTAQIGSSLIPDTGALGNFFQGMGINLYWNGTNYVTHGDGSNNGGEAILGTQASGSNLSFYNFPSTGGAGQTVTPSNLNNFMLGQFDATGNLYFKGSSLSNPLAKLTQSNTDTRTYLFPDASGTICISGAASGCVIAGSFTTTAATTDNVTIAGMTSSGHCTFSPTNASAATNIATTYISAKTTNQITVAHTATGSMTYDLICTPN